MSAPVSGPPASRGGSGPTSGGDIQRLHATTDLPRHEVERLLQAATGRSRSEFFGGVGLSGKEEASFLRLVERRLSGEPLQYIEQVITFGPVDVAVDHRVLIPRPETEQMLERAIATARSPRVIVDLCTGSGNVALALKHTFPAAEVYASDVSPGAVALATENAVRNKLDISVLEGDLFESLPRSILGRVDLLTANPPYIAASDFSGLPIDVRDHEPREALIAGPRGVEVIARIASGADRWLAPNGVVVCEIGEGQGDDVRRFFRDFTATVERDLADRDRFLVARKRSAGSLGA